MFYGALLRCAAVGFVLFFVGCDSSDDSSERLSKAGETCSKTGDCESPLVCLSAVCQVEGSDCPTDMGCNGLECGLDPICGQSCGSCSDSEICDEGQCIEEPCVPDCNALECGLDPICGQTCGNCGDSKICDEGQCIEEPCVPDCNGLECGLDPVCEVSCGNCSDGEICQEGQCTIGSCYPNCGDEVLIPAGTFWMGCNVEVDSDCRGDEFPYHEVYLSAYYIDHTEVTVDVYSACVTAGVCTVPSPTWSYCNWGVAGKASHPVNCVTWHQVDEFCAWVGKRLPTEAEWEKAARGTDGRKFPWGNEEAMCEYAVMYMYGSFGCGADSTWEVCSKSPAGDSPYGLCDMAGNVWEWTADWWDSGYYEISPANNPQGPSTGSSRVLHGGSFNNSDDYLLRASIRNYNSPSYGNYGLGFRCARSE
jgi:formylglycine-generating enzyme required for sulfatase activity